MIRSTGTCGTCRGRIVSGHAHVEWDAAPGFARLKREKGDILMCQARPTSDCTLRVPARITAHADPETVPAHRTARIENVRRLVHDVLDFELVDQLRLGIGLCANARVAAGETILVIPKADFAGCDGRGRARERVARRCSP